MRLIVEISILSIIYLVGYFITSFFELIIPPAFIGMAILLLLITTNIIPSSFFQVSSSFLNRHVILFLLPILVGLMNYGETMKTYGVQFIVIIIVSTIIALVVTSSLMRIKKRKRRS